MAGHQHQKQVQVLTLEDTRVERALVLYNDEVNTFDWVIECLVDICQHSAEQAEQCALIVHYKGKYAVMHGDYDFLEPRCTALLDRGLSAEIH
ncbi:MAG: ATP-dependent Clp protease adaptor ClpS [Bacteroidetes bacterium]|nr:ATP-dependent Clp protease adaptor ClpS [Bacteroidota bacterium]